MTINIDLRDTASEAVQGMRTRIADSATVHAVIAMSSERFVKDFGARNQEHRSAARLGARPTGHLYKAYQDIEGASDASSARLLVPRSSRLRAAFGGYTARPTGGRKYLTIPVAAEAYGKRAGEIQGLEFMRVGPKKTPILARPDGQGRITTFYLLAKQADIPADEGLIPVEAMTRQAADAAEQYILTGGQS
jgi:hypothetical protein